MKPSFAMQLQLKAFIGFILIVLGSVSYTVKVRATGYDDKSAEDIKPALTVATTKPQITQLAQTINARGDIAAWQEAIIGNETDGLRLSEVKVNVGDKVKKGELLAIFAAETVEADLAQIHARLSESKANFDEAAKNARRVRKFKGSGAMSEQEIDRYLIKEQVAKASLEAQQSALKIQKLRLKQTRVLAPDDGVISFRSATVGAVLKAGQELFHLIRQNRLEWRAEVSSSELALLKAGDLATIKTPSGSVIQGKVRMIAPTVDPQTRLGLVYVDLPAHPETKSGMFAEGIFYLGSSDVLMVEQKAVVERDGFSYVFKLEGDNRVSQVKVKIGRRSGNHVEVKEGLEPDAVLVLSGVGFLNDGDLVKVVTSANFEKKDQKF
jgi:RND family efflux transporter MFP subunit